MRVVQINQPFSFGYTNFDQQSSLFVAFNIYDVSSGTAVFLEKVVGSYTNSGNYVGIYSGDAGLTYLIIGIVYTDNTYTTPEIYYAPTVNVVHVEGGNNIFSAYAYGTYDQQSGLAVLGSVYNLTSGTGVLVDTQQMDEVDFGVYLATFNGIVGNTYQQLGVVYEDNTFTVVDPNRAPSNDVFDCNSAGNAIEVIGAAYLVGANQYKTNFRPLPTGRHPINPPLHFTQGDRVALLLTAVDGNGDAVDLTGAILRSFIKGPNGSGVNSYGNSQHTINVDQVNFKGQFLLDLTDTDTLNIGADEHKEIITEVKIGSGVVNFRGFNICTVYSPVPFE